MILWAARAFPVHLKDVYCPWPYKYTKLACGATYGTHEGMSQVGVMTKPSSSSPPTCTAGLQSENLSFGDSTAHGQCLELN